MAMNISACQLDRGDYLVDILKAACAKYNVSPGTIKLELTETAIMHNPKQAETLLSELSELGFAIALDDFGQGFSSLSLLSRLPISTLKIDKQFISDLNEEKNEFIVKSILSLSESLSLHVIAEGIETQSQLDYLINHHCHYGQGYYFSKPEIADNIITLFINTNNEK